MRLTHIKLAGFKSFVDPTVIPVPGQLVAVVGPNGCGKSNVIDAVRWVLGESSAKQLRGESMQDVIFNGSTGRKPVSRASVELVFDNQDGQLAGAWGRYSEISIKRVLTRQGESSYYINNQAVRRRDITDLFLGTGVGARGYAVIEQGMISRIIEARPEELRTYLEEAAGISRYKDRRKETESRLIDTRDHLDRVADLQLELTRQVNKLNQQAEVASLYQSYKNELTLKQNILAYSRKEEARRQEAEAQAKLANLETEETQSATQLNQINTALNTVRTEHDLMNEQVMQQQSELADLNMERARIEQASLHRNETKQRLASDNQRIDAERALIKTTQGQWETELAAWQGKLADAKQAENQALMQCEMAQMALPEQEDLFKGEAARFHQTEARINELTRARDLAEQKQMLQRQSLQQFAEQEIGFEQELQNLNLPSEEAVEDAKIREEKLDKQFKQVKARIENDETQRQQTLLQKDQLDKQLQNQRLEFARLEAEAQALKTLLAQDVKQEALVPWLEKLGLAQAPMLWEQVQIDGQWQKAFEAILDQRLLGRTTTQTLDELPPSSCVLIDQPTAAIAEANTALPWPKLCDQLQADHALYPVLQTWLHGVYCVESLEAAQEARNQLPAGACLVTPEGHCIDAVSIWYFAQQRTSHVMDRKAALDRIAQKMAELAPQLAQQETALQDLQSRINQYDTVIVAQKEALSRIEVSLKEAGIEAASLAQSAAQGSARLQAIDAERKRIQSIKESMMDAIEDAMMTVEETAFELQAIQTKMAEMKLAKLNAETGLDLARNAVRDAEKKRHEASLARAVSQQKVAELQEKQNQAEQRLLQLLESEQRLAEEAQRYLEELPSDALIEIVKQCEAKSLVMQQIKSRFAELNERLQALQNQQQQLQKEQPSWQNRRSEWLLKHQEARINVERFTEELALANVNEAEIAKVMPGQVSPQKLMQDIARLAKQVDELGPVNLAALKELEEAQQRETYLRQQSDDLNQAMATLMDAINRIDAETRDMLKATYDQVNAKMGEFFPTLFGGGRAELVLTGDDLLNSGMQIIAQPPGKKNSSIHLLSGGEKALTAVSLVFSLFSLNPAPFCLLDEVDAPLDDANTGRFCDLVKKMSDKTQFLYISHNRLTMEMAEQLVGVTMQEQGASRIVAVDIVEALKMRES